MAAVLRGGRDSVDGELCVQAVFALLDTLRKWLTTLQGRATPAASGAPPQRVHTHTHTPLPCDCAS